MKDMCWGKKDELAKICEDQEVILRKCNPINGL